MTRSAVAYWVNQFNASQSTLATRTSERDSARNSLYVSGVYGSGVTWQSQDATDVANYNAEVALYNDMVNQRNAAQTNYNNEVTLYNNLLNGLNSPDGLTSVGISASYVGSGSQSGATATLTIPRTGHYLIAIDCRHSITMTSGTSGFIQNNLSGLATETYVINLTAASGTQTPCYSKVIHGDFTAGQTLSLNFTAFRGDGSASGAIYAHFIPDSTHHN